MLAVAASSRSVTPAQWPAVTSVAGRRRRGPRVMMTWAPNDGRPGPTDPAGFWFRARKVQHEDSEGLSLIAPSLVRG